MEGTLHGMNWQGFEAERYRKRISYYKVYIVSILESRVGGLHLCAHVIDRQRQ